MGLTDFFGSVGLGAANMFSNLVGQSYANRQSLNNSMKLMRLQNYYNSTQQSELLRQNRIDATTAYNRQRELMDYQLQYNSPSAQVARLRAAGLNPNLAFAGGSLNNVAAFSTDAPQSSPASAIPASSTVFGQQPFAGTDSFINSLSAVSNLQYQDKQAKSVGLDNQRKSLENYILSRTAEDKIRGIKGYEDSRRLLGDYQRQLLLNLGKDFDLKQQDYDFNEDFNPKRLVGAEQDNQLKAQQWQINELNQRILKIDSDNHSKMVALQLVATLENIRTLQSQQFLNTKQALAAIQMARQSAANAFGLEKENAFNFGDNPLTDNDGSINWKGIFHGVGTGIKMWLTGRSRK